MNDGPHEKVLCWCNSGLSFKRCHFNRDKQPPVTLGEIKSVTDKVYGKKYCLHPNATSRGCAGKIVRAHTIQRNGGLSRIARSGHVITLMPRDIMSILQQRDPSVRPREAGIGEASTFTGFCERHDNETFAPIEKYPFQASKQHCFLLAYRAICREVSTPV